MRREWVRLVPRDLADAARPRAGGVPASAIAFHAAGTERIKETLAAVLTDKAAVRQPASGPA